MWVPGLQEKSRLPGDSNTCRTGPGLEVNQEPCWCESVLTAVPRHHVSVRFYFSCSCQPDDGTGKTPESSNHGARCEATIWWDGRSWRTLSWSRSTKKSHKMKKGKPCLKHHHNYYNAEAVKLHPVIYFCLKLSWKRIPIFFSQFCVALQVRCQHNKVGYIHKWSNTARKRGLNCIGWFIKSLSLWSHKPLGCF